MKRIKNITQAKLELPFSKGLYAIVGENGCGKSTIMLALSLMIKKSSVKLLTNYDIENQSQIIIKLGDRCDEWRYNNERLSTNKYANYKGRKVMDSDIEIEGFYEGSIFYGSRFNDYSLIDDFIENADLENDLINADEFVKETLGYILHNNKKYYASLLKVKNRDIAKKYNFRGMPYFFEKNGNYISQFRMSSGESMLISLIDFLNNLVVRSTAKKDLLFLIDEVELALHPSAIDRLVEVLSELIKTSKRELIVYFSTHSAELLHRINNRNIFLLENFDGNIICTNPCYPNYAIRNLYIPNGFDFILLVEDELSKSLVEKVLRDNNLGKSKLICVLPAGGCTQMLKLHNDMITYNTLGVGKRIISIYDGDVKKDISGKEKYKALPKCFLPVPSIEKYLKYKLIDNLDLYFIKLIGDKYFTQRSLKDIVLDYQNDSRTLNGSDNDGKILYKVICSNLIKSGIDEQSFVKYLCDDIYSYEDLTKFITTLSKLLM
ncbi:ATP-dependent nuclease [Clostridioides difficile]